jgi:hypothetical protein
LTVAAGVLLSALIVVSRVLARQKSFWEWDDYIFGLALHLFAPQASVPQPPFFPVFIGFAKFARLFASSDVVALTSVNVCSSIAAPGVLFLIVRELFDDARVAVTAAVLFAFFPAVWFSAGSPLTDPAGLCFALLAFWLSLVAWRRAAFLAPAAAAFGLACGIRPQAASVALVPLLVAFVKNRGRIAWAAGMVLAASVFAFAILPVVVAAGGVRRVVAPLKRQWTYTVGYTSPLARTVAPAFLARRWLVDPWITTSLAVIVAAIAIFGLALLASTPAGRRRAVFLTASFGPYFACAWLFLDATFSGRYVLPALPAVAVFLAVAVAFAERRVAPRKLPFAAFVIVSAMAAKTAPAVLVLHRRDSPPVEAASRVRASTGPGRFSVLFPAQMYVPAELLFPGVPKYEAEKTPVSVLAASPIPVWRFGVPADDDDRSASWPALRTFSAIGTGRYLRVPYGIWRAESAVFGKGWYPEELDGDQRFRWMGGRAVIRFPPSPNPLTVRFTLVAPLRLFARPPALTVEWDGGVLERRMILSDRTDISYRLPPATRQGTSALVLSSTETFNPRRAGSSGDKRDLSFELRSLSWSASSPSPSSGPRSN